MKHMIAFIIACIVAVCITYTFHLSDGGGFLSGVICGAISQIIASLLLFRYWRRRNNGNR
jgi:multisubunit Na+/H+ antiporter MnhB subunit